MERERRRWEEEQEEKLDKPVGPVHYEEMRQGGKTTPTPSLTHIHTHTLTNTHTRSLLLVEVRTHGVGYYSFSQDEEKRSEQLNLLNHLRDQVLL